MVLEIIEWMIVVAKMMVIHKAYYERADEKVVLKVSPILTLV